MCIQNGYSYVYKALAASKTNVETVAAAGAYATSVVTSGKTNSVNICKSTPFTQSTHLESMKFKNPAVAIANCPMKADVCGTTTATLATIGATAVDVTVKTLTAKDQCTYFLKATCGMPAVTAKVAAGNYLKPSYINVDFIEGKGDPATVLDVAAEPQDVSGWSALGDGSLYSYMTYSTNYGDYADASVVSLLKSKTLGRMKQSTSHSWSNLADQVKERNAVVAKYNTAVAKYEKDFAAFQAQLTKKGENWIQVNYPKTPVEVQKFKTVFPTMPVAPPAVKDLVTPLETAKWGGVFTQGYGALTLGSINVVQGQKKSFGVQGQGTAADKGYMWPVEKTGACVAKFIAVNVYPTDPDFTTAAADKLTLSFTSENPQKFDFTQTAFAANSEKYASDKAVIAKYMTYAQEQELAEFLGASSLVAAAASVASLAAMTLF